MPRLPGDVSWLAEQLGYFDLFRPTRSHAATGGHPELHVDDGLARGAAVGEVASGVETGDGLECGEVPGVRDNPCFGERQPGPGLPADSPLLDPDVAGVLEQCDLFGEHGVADLHAVSHRGELRALDGSQGRDDGEADAVREQAIEVVA